MPKAKKLPSGSWRCQVYLGKDENGKRVMCSVTAATKKEAEFLASEAALKRKSGQQPKNLTLREAISEYIALKENILSPETVRGYLVIQRNRFKRLMPMTLSAITAQNLQRAINDDAKYVSEKTLRNSVGLVKSVIHTFAPGTELDVSLPQRKKYEPHILTIEQTATLLHAIQGDRAEMSILLAIWLGLRASEVRGIRWDAYDPKKSTLTIKETLVKDKNNQLVSSTTKTTDSTRVLLVPRYIAEKLEKLKAESNGDYIISLPYHAEYKRLQMILKKAGLPPTRFHDLRHLNASLMLLLGIPQKYAMERGGWSSSQTMEKIYQHTFVTEREAADRKVNDFLENLLKAENEKSSHESSHT